MEDFTSFKYPFVYPETAYVEPTQFKSHGDFLQAAALRYNINGALHALDVERLRFVLDFVKNFSEPMQEA